MTHKIKKLFIANRGEICRRIGTTAQQLGITTVAITDQKNPPAFLCQVIDEFIKVDVESTALYLDANKIIALAKSAKADAIHPGFGFLSENASFAKAVVDAGLTWVGPTAKSIDLMASKALARDAAVAAKVPCIEGLQNFHTPKDADGDFSELLQFAKKTGYPLLIKAALGGGGKGMRTVYSDAELPDAVIRAHSEALSSFGDGELICEQYLENPRHIEVQILADKHGNVYAIGDRDCSMQRRHQKVIEEAPAPLLLDSTRAAMYKAAVELAKAVDYDSTGTVEFLIDWSAAAQKSKKQNFYFLEMNTRLQVEHPVTEEVFGIDLVEWQLNVAAGLKLPDSYADLQPRGHSIEVRLYAEDVDANFFPAPGPVGALFKAHGPGIRWELGLDTVDEITGNFDPMISKLITTAETRQGALQRMVFALEHTFFAGPTANLAFLTYLCKSSDFAKGPIATSFLGTHIDEILKGIEKDKAMFSESAIELLAKLESGELFKAAALREKTNSLAITQRIFSNQNSKATSDETSEWNIISQMVTENASGQESQSGIVSKVAADNSQKLFHYSYLSHLNNRYYWVGHQSHVWRKIVTKSSTASSSGDANQSEELLANVPGKVTLCKVSVGDSVKKGDCVFILESMKMEFEVKSPKDGIIKALNVSKGDQVKSGQKLADWK